MSFEIKSLRSFLSLLLAYQQKKIKDWSFHIHLKVLNIVLRLELNTIPLDNGFQKKWSTMTQQTTKMYKPMFADFEKCV